MVKHFKRCLYAKYIHTAESGDYAIEIDGDTLYILFQKSSGAEDWKNNFSFPAKPYKRMNTVWFCHGGFLKVWKAMRDDIEAYVREILSSHTEIKKIKCIGFSHGAPLSALCTEDMEYLYGIAYEVYGYGFGAPRLLWGIVPKEVKYRLRNFKTIRNIPDIVTHVPPALFGFRKVGTLVKIGKWGKYGPFKAHYPSSYTNELNAMKGEE